MYLEVGQFEVKQIVSIDWVGLFLHLLCLFFGFYFLNSVLHNAVASVAQEYVPLLSKIAERLDFLYSWVLICD